jgi:hypothetical protein
VLTYHIEARIVPERGLGEIAQPGERYRLARISEANTRSIKIARPPWLSSS